MPDAMQISDVSSYSISEDERTAYVKLRVRRKTSSQWTSSTEVIPFGEPCFASDTGELRIGDGVGTWVQLKTCLGLPSDLYRREYRQDSDGVTRQYTRVLIDDGELI